MKRKYFKTPTGTGTIPFVILLMIVIITGCRTDSGPPCESYHEIPQELQDYAMFQPGSYWIYRDTATGVIDSVYLISQTIEHSERTPDEQYCYKYIDQRFFSSYENLMVGGESHMISDDPIIFLYRGKVGVFLSNIEPGTKIDEIEYISLIDTLLIGTSYYYKVKHFMNYGNSNYYLVKNIGSIRKSWSNINFADSSVCFDLIRYHINN